MYVVPEVASRTDTLLRAADFESAWGYPKCLVRREFYGSPKVMCKKLCKFLLDESPHPAHPQVTKVRDRGYRLQRFMLMHTKLDDSRSEEARI